MTILAGLLGLFLMLIVIWEGFETIILPRSVTRQLRLTRGFYLALWPFSTFVAKRLSESRRQLFLSYFGPVSLPLLLVFWAQMLVLAFALMQWSLPFGLTRLPGMNRWETALYQSGVTFFTLGYGDVTPHTRVTRFVAVLEAGIGFAFLAVVIGYLPVLYQAFSRRRVHYLSTGCPRLLAALRHGTAEASQRRLPHESFDRPAGGLGKVVFGTAGIASLLSRPDLLSFAA